MDRPRKVSSNLSRISSSTTLAMNDKAKRMARAGVQGILFMTVGEPDFPVPPHVAEAMVKAISDGKTRYTETQGILELREAIAEKLSTENGIAARPEEVLVSVGAKQALFNALMSLLDPGDEVVIPVPYWVSYPEMVKVCGGVPVYATPADGVLPGPEEIIARFGPSTKALILNSPCNPSGCVMDPKDLAAIAAAAFERGIFVVSDEIYEKVIFDASHFSPASMGSAARELTFTVNGMSKSHSMTGLRVGYVHGPLDFIKAAVRLQGHTTSNPCSISQYGALAAIKGPADCVTAMREAYLHRSEKMVRGLEGTRGFSCPDTRGTFYVFPRVSIDGLDGDSLAAVLLDELKIASVPGSGFGCPDRIRFSCAVPEADIDEMINRLRARFGPKEEV